MVTDYLRISNDVFGRKSKAILFSAGIAHGEKLVNDFAAAGVNAVQLASGVEDDYRDDVFREFAKPDSSIDMIISAEMLTRASRGAPQVPVFHYHMGAALYELKDYPGARKALEAAEKLGKTYAEQPQAAALMAKLPEA